MAPGVTGNSQFRSPDNPYGKGGYTCPAAPSPASLFADLLSMLDTTVGVVGSGKGMTSYEQKKRTKFDEGALGDE